MNLLGLLARGYLGPGDEAIYTEHGFLVYRIAILTNGATPIVAPERDLKTDVDAILARVTERTRVVFVANPNNPTGTYIPIDDVRRLRAGLRDDILLVLDAAYAEYVSNNDYEAGIELVATTSNTVMTRTFSKIYGLAALRVGWAYCPEAVAGVLNRIRGPFNLSSPAIASAAAAIEDTAHLERAKHHNDEWLPWVASELQKLGLTVTPSVANFVLFHFKDNGGKTANDADDLSQIARHHPAQGRRLRLPECAAHDDRFGERQQADNRGTRRISQRRGLMSEHAGTSGERMFKRLALIGVGLIGSSISHAARRAGLVGEIVGCSSTAETRDKAEALGLVTKAYADPADAVRGADLVILCTPVGAYGEIAKAIGPHLEKGAIVSDVGSVKAAAVRDIAPHIPGGVHFIAGHPVAGTEQSGPEAGFAELFDGRWCILTPEADADRMALAKLETFWQRLGSQVEIMTPEHHDLVLAITSHIPHLIAYNIVNTAAHLGARNGQRSDQVFGRRLSRFHAHCRVRSGDVARRIFEQQRGRARDAWPLFRRPRGVAARHPLLATRATLERLFAEARAIRRGIIQAGQDTARPDFGRRPEGTKPSEILSLVLGIKPTAVRL